MRIGDTFKLKGYDVHAMAMGDSWWALLLCNNSTHYLVAVTHDSHDDPAADCLLCGSFVYADEPSARRAYSRALELMAREALGLAPWVQWPGADDAQLPRRGN